VPAKGFGWSVSSWALAWCLFSSLAVAQDRGTSGGWSTTSAADDRAGMRTISADILRNPISPKTRRSLQRALEWMRLGKHSEAIRQLEETLAKDPSCAAFAQSLLGYEYMQTDQFTAAVASFEQAVTLMPHDAINRTNFGISLAATGEYQLAEQQAKRGHELDPGNSRIQRFYDAIAAYNRSTSVQTTAKGIGHGAR
jgi:tetratricopeptide (TPR) repeat protein